MKISHLIEAVRKFFNGVMVELVVIDHTQDVFVCRCAISNKEGSITSMVFQKAFSILTTNTPVKPMSRRCRLGGITFRANGHTGSNQLKRGDSQWHRSNRNWSVNNPDFGMST